MLIIHRLRAAGGPDVFDGAALLILLRPPKLQVVFIGKPGGLTTAEALAMALPVAIAYAELAGELAEGISREGCFYHTQPGAGPGGQ